MLFYSIIEKYRRNSHLFLLPLPIFFGFITEIFGGKLNNRKCESAVIVVLKWIMDYIL